MNAETIKRLKAWFYLHVAPEDWSKFGSSAATVLRTFDDDPDQENALLRFVAVVTLLEVQKLDHTSAEEAALGLQIIKQRKLELQELGLTRPKISVFRMRRDELPVRPGQIPRSDANLVGSGDRRPRVSARQGKITKIFRVGII